MQSLHKINIRPFPTQVILKNLLFSCVLTFHLHANTVSGHWKLLENSFQSAEIQKNVPAMLIYKVLTDDYFHLYNLLIIFWKNLLVVCSTKCQKSPRQQPQMSGFVHKPNIFSLLSKKCRNEPEMQLEFSLFSLEDSSWTFSRSTKSR